MTRRCFGPSRMRVCGVGLLAALVLFSSGRAQAQVDLSVSGRRLRAIRTGAE
jgi:hypothetical protein